MRASLFLFILAAFLLVGGWPTAALWLALGAGTWLVLWAVFTVANLLPRRG